MRRAISLAAATAIAVACGGSGGADAGADAAADAALACAPSDAGSTSGLTPPHPAHLGKCSAQQILDYAQCQGAQQTSLCPQFASGQPAADCGTCIESQLNSPTWGVIVFTGSTATFNIEGCVDDALGEVALERANGGGGSCGDLLHDSYTCQESACSACSGTEFEACDNATLFAGDDASTPGACHALDVAASSSTQCAPLFSATPPSDVTQCFPDASLNGDPTKQEVDWLQRIVTYMCGP